MEKEICCAARASGVRRATDWQVDAVAKVAAGCGGLAGFFAAGRARRVPAQPRSARPAMPGAAEVAPPRDGGGGRGAERAGGLRRGAASLRFRPAPVAVRVVRQFRPQAARDGRELAVRTQPTASFMSVAVDGTTGSRRREVASRDAVANADARRGGLGGGFPGRTCPSGSFSANCRSWRPRRALSVAIC